ncbi:MAG: sigma-70 family RNA polymerase sigma factor [Candidatus Marinimicrobia bacterium]|nr:sigma-70 family RNA polymerase sigma factor [Candidatus Neomarinimicrobiota bacterium]MCF7904437.1 sigma-70 family RNA polymerase sigma factor [Candidatus Neomarinimicrobiota bacterium]
MNDLKDKTDEQLIAAFQQDDENAFVLLVERYRDRLINFVYRFLNDMTDAEDLVQETFVKVYRKKHSYREIAKFSTWIYTIAGNLARSELRKRKRRKTYTMSSLGYEDTEFTPVDTGKDTEGIVFNSYAGEEIMKAIDQLPEPFKTITILRDIQELSYEDISTILDIPMGTVKSRVNRARLKLQETLSYLRE